MKYKFAKKNCVEKMCTKNFEIQFRKKFPKKYIFRKNNFHAKISTKNQKKHIF